MSRRALAVIWSMFRAGGAVDQERCRDQFVIRLAKLRHVLGAELLAGPELVGRRHALGTRAVVRSAPVRPFTRLDEEDGLLQLADDVFTDVERESRFSHRGAGGDDDELLRLEARW